MANKPVKGLERYDQSIRTCAVVISSDQVGIFWSCILITKIKCLKMCIQINLFSGYGEYLLNGVCIGLSRGNKTKLEIRREKSDPYYKEVCIEAPHKGMKSYFKSLVRSRTHITKRCV